MDRCRRAAVRRTTAPVHGLPRGGALAEAAAAIRSAVVARHRDSAETILKSAEEDLRVAFGGLEVITLASDVPVDQMLTEQSRTGQMVVLGSEAVSAAAAMLVGSTTRPVVLGVEDAAIGPAAFDAGFELASQFRGAASRPHTPG